MASERSPDWVLQACQWALYPKAIWSPKVHQILSARRRPEPASF